MFIRFGLVLLGLLFSVIPSFAQTAMPIQPDSATFRSYTQARSIIERAINAHGGLAKIRALTNVTLEYDGQRTMINQSRQPKGPWDKEPSGGKLVVDRTGNRMYALSYNSYPGIGRFGGAWALTGNEGFHWEPFVNHHGSEIMAKFSGSDADGPWAFIPRWMPPLMLLAAWDNNTNLRWVESYQRAGRRYDAVSYVQRDRSNAVLIFDAATGMFEGFEYVRDDGVYGDATEFVHYRDYREVAGVKFPAKRIDYMNGQIAREMEMRYTANTLLDDSLFKLPAGIAEASASTPSGRIKKIGDGVYLDEGIGGVMIVEFKDFLVVVECPGNYWMSQGTIDAARKATGNKPIKYVVPSHTHGDHGGGARAYFHAGTTLITTAGNVEFYKDLARIKQTIRPDPFSTDPREPVIEVMNGKRVISDGTQTLELYDLGPNPHTDELIFAHLPKQKILWQSDIIFNPFTGNSINKAMPIGIVFAKRLKELGISSFDKMVEAHHSRVISQNEFRRGLELAGSTEY